MRVFKAFGLFAVVFGGIVLVLILVGGEQLAHGSTKEEVGTMSNAVSFFGFCFAILTASLWYWTGRAQGK